MLDNNTEAFEEDLRSDMLAPVETVEDDRGLEVAGAGPMRLQTLDFARHQVIAPNGKFYVLATYDDRHMGRGWVTAVYPQQNNLTLIRLLLVERSSETLDDAIDLHQEWAKELSQGRVPELQSKVPTESQG